jgi:hypothetical protein
MADQSEGASPICPCRISEGYVYAHHIPDCPNDPHPHRRSEGASPTWMRKVAMDICATRQADWEAGRDAAKEVATAWATSISCTAHDNDPCCHVRTGREIEGRIAAIPYPGPSGATNMPQSEQTWPCTRCGKSHRQLEGCFLGPLGAQDAPTKNCEHERVDEDGYCRKCGSDTRGGFCLAQDAPQPQSDERRNALESLLPGRAVNAAQTDWGKGYIEGWLAKSQAKEGERR